MLHQLAIAAAAIALAGCATEPVSTADAVPGRLLEAALGKPGPGTQAVIIKRDLRPFARACTSTIYVNGRPAGEIDPGQMITIHLPPGDHMLGARANDFLCVGGLVEMRLTVRDRASAVRVGYGAAGDFFIVPTAF